MSAPFYAFPAEFDGADPGDPIYWPTVPGRFWLGKPEQMMIELPSPFHDGYQAAVSNGSVEHGLMGGGSAESRFGSATRRWTLPYQRLAGRDRQVLDAFARWVAVGPPPWVFIGPEDNNRLTLAQSLCGAKNGEVEGWLSSDGLVSYEAATAARIFPAGVMSWEPGGASEILAAGADGDTAGNPDVDHAAPYLPGMPATWIIWAKVTGAAATLKARISGRLANGTVDTELDGPNVVLNSSAWQPLWLTAEAATLGGSQYLVPEVVCVATGSTVLLCCPDLRYEDAPGDWELGGGAPRVNWPTAQEFAVDVHRNRDLTVTLAETMTGAL